jgi:hypothetical protein
MDKDKAIVISTGEILEVKSFYKIMNLTIEFPEDLSWVSGSVQEFDRKIFVKSDKVETSKPGDYYILSDGKKYSGDELIVGLDNIREYKLKKLI